ncbi:SUMF1/EgtB/PvdO family nonheme iron enzyme [Chloroflexi bacterium TSY]|nr:SUMF1/EgtB/PvdO family nonheme iron enzyme [Chloroflexi bacterium TSY]
MNDIRRFLANWHLMLTYGQMGQGADAELYAERQTEQLLSAIRSNERIRDLAINPLMLTVIAMVHRDRVKLPDRRAELYAEAVDVLLGKWDEARGVQEAPILENKTFDTGDRRLMLQSIALHMHEQGRKDIELDELNLLLNQLFYDITGEARSASKAAERFLAVIRERTGLLIARGEGHYAFSHLTFQEFLAALALLSQNNYIDYALEYSDRPWWRQVILLAAGTLSTQSKERTADLIRAIAQKRQEPVLYYNLALASECIRDVGSSRIGVELSSNINQRLRGDLDRDLMEEIEKFHNRSAWQKRWSRLLPSVAGTEEECRRQILERKSVLIQALAQAGGGFWTQPYGEPEWISIPSGSFWMGSEAYEQEQPLHQLHLGSFQIAKVPITNAQYQLFIQDTCRTAPEHWEDDQPPRGLECHPVARVTWHDAIAYCEWLSKKTGKQITLPSEAQWERAARGAQDQRQYPWGDKFDKSKCNCYSLNFQSTTPVGIFPNGASLDGCLDMAGNVWEWTRSLWGTDWEKTDFGYPYDPTDGRENLSAGDDTLRVLRGGSFANNDNGVRCANRDRNDPDYRLNFIGFRCVVSPFSLRTEGSDP